MIEINLVSARIAIYPSFFKGLLITLALSAGVPVNAIGQTDESGLSVDSVAVVAELHADY